MASETKNSRFNFQSLKFRLPVSILLAVAVPLVLFSAFGYMQVEKIFAKVKLGDMMNTVDTKYIQVLDLLDRGKSDVHQLAENPGITQPLAAYEQTANANQVEALNEYLADLQGLQASIQPLSAYTLPI